MTKRLPPHWLEVVSRPCWGGTWTTAAEPVNATISSAENGAAPDTVTVTIPVGTEPRLYARLRVIAQ